MELVDINIVAITTSWCGPGWESIDLKAIHTMCSQHAERETAWNMKISSRPSRPKERDARVCDVLNEMLECAVQRLVNCSLGSSCVSANARFPYVKGNAVLNNLLAELHSFTTAARSAFVQEKKHTHF